MIPPNVSTPSATTFTVRVRSKTARAGWFGNQRHEVGEVAGQTDAAALQGKQPGGIVDGDAVEDRACGKIIEGRGADASAKEQGVSGLGGGAAPIGGRAPIIIAAAARPGAVGRRGALGVEPAGQNRSQEEVGRSK
jgi:hypothetical protein